MNGSALIAQERQRQMAAEGWTPAHDDGYVSAELTNAACAYAETAALQMYEDEPDPPIELVPDCWPWHLEWWKPSADPIRNLVKAGALIAAEIDRITRSREPKGDCPTCKHAWKCHCPYGEYPNGCRVTVEQDGEKCHCPCRPIETP